MKKGVIIVDRWQIHNLSFSQEDVDKAFPGQNAKPMLRDKS